MVGTHSAVNEDTQGQLQSFLIGENGALSGPIDTISSGGDSPAFTTALSTGQVAIMNVRHPHCSLVNLIRMETCSTTLGMEKSSPLNLATRPSS